MRFKDSGLKHARKEDGIAHNSPFLLHTIYGSGLFFLGVSTPSLKGRLGLTFDPLGSAVPRVSSTLDDLESLKRRIWDTCGLQFQLQGSGG